MVNGRPVFAYQCRPKRQGELSSTAAGLHHHHIRPDYDLARRWLVAVLRIQRAGLAISPG